MRIVPGCPKFPPAEPAGAREPAEHAHPAWAGAGPAAALGTLSPERVSARAVPCQQKTNPEQRLSQDMFLQ